MLPTAFIEWDCGDLHELTGTQIVLVPAAQSGVQLSPAAEMAVSDAACSRSIDLQQRAVEIQALSRWMSVIIHRLPSLQTVAEEAFVCCLSDGLRVNAMCCMHQFAGFAANNVLLHLVCLQASGAPHRPYLHAQLKLCKRPDETNIIPDLDPNMQSQAGSPTRFSRTHILLSLTSALTLILASTAARLPSGWLRCRPTRPRRTWKSTRACRSSTPSCSAHWRAARHLTFPVSTPLC